MNSGDDAVTLIYLLGCVALVGSALAVRRLPIGQTMKMVGAWLLIFGVAFAVFALRDDFKALARRLLADGQSQVVEQGGTVRIRRSEDGHYWADAEVNGESVRFLVDNGATVTSLGKSTAERSRVDISSGIPVAVETANGTVFLRRGTASSLEVGPIERRDLALWVGQGEDEVNVLGMNFLSSLSSWGTEDGMLVLRP